MSDLAATNCNTECGCNNDGGCSWIIWILILLSCCGNNNGFGNFGCGCGNNDSSCIIWILLILCCCGNGNSFC